jgi:cobalt transporter subunit CbtB
MGRLVGLSATELARLTALFAPPFLAILLGAFLVIGAGFAPLATIHNAAHDARHSFAFPCH